MFGRYKAYRGVTMGITGLFVGLFGRVFVLNFFASDFFGLRSFGVGLASYVLWVNIVVIYGSYLYVAGGTFINLGYFAGLSYCFGCIRFGCLFVGVLGCFATGSIFVSNCFCICGLAWTTFIYFGFGRHDTIYIAYRGTLAATRVIARGAMYFTSGFVCIFFYGLFLDLWGLIGPFTLFFPYCQIVRGYNEYTITF